VVGDPADAATAVGPLIGEDPRDTVVAAAVAARQDGGEVLCGGTAVPRDGWFAEPTVVYGLSPDADLAQEEVFGPICAVLDAGSADEAAAIADWTRYGLVASVYTRDLDAALRFAARLDVGMVRVNAPTSGVDYWVPFGGERDSGHGPREQGKAARDFYTTRHTITISPAVAA
jgi:acyl-CoA reductase-like NAD-dependent aldehyde dehydrogenase